MSIDETSGISRRDFVKITAASALGALTNLKLLHAASGKAGGKRKRVLVLGIDGMSPILLRQYVAKGRMPNFAKLIKQGDFKHLRTSNPPQSPVAWSNFITGMNPGAHGIYDFIHRDPQTLTPYLSTSRTILPTAVLPLGNWKLPLWGGDVKLLRHGPAFWKILSDRGVPCTLFKLPSNFPPVE